MIILKNKNYQVIDGNRFTANSGPISIRLDRGKIFTIEKVEDTPVGYLIHWKAKINVNKATLTVNGQTYVINEDDFKAIAN